MIVRQLTLNDLADYKFLRLEALRLEPTAFSGDFHEELAQSDHFHATRLQSGAVFGAYHDSTLIGMVGLIRYVGRKHSHHAAIWGVFVTPEYRGQGAARQLMHAALESLPSEVTHITLGVEENNKAAIKLYESLGFIEYGLQPGVFQHDGVLINERLMVKIK